MVDSFFLSKVLKEWLNAKKPGAETIQAPGLYVEVILSINIKPDS